MLAGLQADIRIDVLPDLIKILTTTLIFCAIFHVIGRECSTT
jgi:hypothetical protein